jgi:ABC-type uncharacterized transport system substrate-binding protein
MGEFTGTSDRGDINEAIRNAVKKAIESLGKTDVKWSIQNAGGSKLELDKISVTIQTKGAVGDKGIGPQ